MMRPSCKARTHRQDANGNRASVVYVEGISEVEVTAGERGGPNTPAVLIE